MKWNVSEAGVAIGVSGQTWRNWEEGKGCRTMPETCRKIAEVSGCDYRWLIAGGPHCSLEFGLTCADLPRWPRW